MGIFHEMVTLVNRTSKPLPIRFDGQDLTLKPGDNAVPRIVVPYAKSQCVLNGSEDPRNPRSFISLVGVRAAEGQKQKDDISPLEQDETQLTRVNLEEYLEDPSAKIVVRGKHKPSSFDANPLPSDGSVFAGE